MAMIAPFADFRRPRCCHAREGGHPVLRSTGRGMGPGESETQTPAEPSGLTSVLDRAFGLSAAGTTMPTELRAGLATFLTMAYIMFVNPAILEKAGMDHGAVFVATCLAAALCTAFMGLCLLAASTRSTPPLPQLPAPYC